MGGPFHVSLSDGNLETRILVYELMHYDNRENYKEEEKEWLKKHKEDMRVMVTMLLDLKEKERYKVVAKAFNEYN